MSSFIETSSYMDKRICSEKTHLISNAFNQMTNARKKRWIKP
jgi:hypothetical protein